MRYSANYLMRVAVGRRTVLRLMVLGAVGVMTLAGSVPAMAASQDDGSFWTTFTPSADTRLIFVSNSEGSDSNSGLTPATPVKSLARGYELMRDGHPDWMLLRRGDVWREAFPTWAKSGRSESEKMVLGAYGNVASRPQVRPDAGVTGINVVGNGLVEHLAFVGFHLEPMSRPDAENSIGIRWMRRSSDILFEDLYVAGFKDNFVFTGGESNPVSDVRINGCVIVDAWSASSHSQGIYVSRTDGFLLENSVVASNGHSIARGVEPTIFNHNIYIQNGVSGVVVRNNIIADASSHGIQLRPGGVIEGNLFISNAIHLLIGMDDGGSSAGTNNIVRRNLIMYAKDISDTLPRRMGIDVGGIRNVIVTENILYSPEDSNNGHAISVADTESRGIEGVQVTSNTLVNWNGRIRIASPNGGSVFDGIQLADNTMFWNFAAAPREMVNLFDSSHPAIEFASNTYHLLGASDRPFRVGSAWTMYDQWIAQVEPDADFVFNSPAPRSIGLDEYLASVGQSGGVQQFLDEARERSRASPKTHLQPQRVFEWAQQRLEN